MAMTSGDYYSNARFDADLKAQAQRELECAGAAGAECLTNALIWYSECRVWSQSPHRSGCRPRHIEVKVRQIADVENIEHLADETKVNLFSELEGLRHTDVL